MCRNEQEVEAERPSATITNTTAIHGDVDNKESVVVDREG